MALDLYFHPPKTHFDAVRAADYAPTPAQQRARRKQIDADLRGEHPNLLQTGQRASDAVVQGLFAGDQLQALALAGHPLAELDGGARDERARALPAEHHHRRRPAAHPQALGLD